MGRGLVVRNLMIQGVSAFVDWNSQIHLHAKNLNDADDNPVLTAGVVLKKTAGRIARCLNKIDSTNRYKVHMRLYHGWHKGYEPTGNKKAITKVLAATDFASLSPLPNVVFSSNVAYGDCLLHAMSSRFHSRLGIHLPNTLQIQHGRVGEKMVDTALASDIVSSAATQSDEWIVVVSEDDDLVPPVFTAEALLVRGSSKVFILQSRARSGNFLKLENIMVRL